MSEIIGRENCTVYSLQCTMYSVQWTVYSVQYTVYSVHYKMYSKVVLLSLWREPQCFSVWEVKPFARLLLCLTSPEDSRAVVGDLEMEWNLVVGDTEMEWNLVVGDTEMEWNWVVGTPKRSEILILNNENRIFWDFLKSI